MQTFSGFKPASFGFLEALSFNNDRAWFQDHKSEYEELILTPALELITVMDPIVRSLSPFYRGVAKKTGGSLMRIYRDTRFSHDKTPYKTNVGIQFRHEMAGDVHAPGFYVHLAPNECFLGAGTWRPAAPELKRIRQFMVEKPKLYTDAVAKATSGTGLALTGDSLKRMPRDFDQEHPIATELRRIDFLVSRDLLPDQYLDASLINLLEGYFSASAPYMAWLCQALGVPWSKVR